MSSNLSNADAVSGHTSVVTFTPTTPGTFGFFSEDEESLGMTGNFVVATVARDVQSLSGQPATTQATFVAVWGDRAAQEWAQEHNAALPR